MPSRASVDDHHREQHRQVDDRRQEHVARPLRRRRRSRANALHEHQRAEHDRGDEVRQCRRRRARTGSEADRDLDDEVGADRAARGARRRACRAASSGRRRRTRAGDRCAIAWVCGICQKNSTPNTARPGERRCGRSPRSSPSARASRRAPRRPTSPSASAASSACRRRRRAAARRRPSAAGTMPATASTGSASAPWSAPNASAVVGVEPLLRQRPVLRARHQAVDVALEPHVERVRRADDQRGAGEQPQRGAQRDGAGAQGHRAGGGEQRHHHDARLDQRDQIDVFAVQRPPVTAHRGLPSASVAASDAADCLSRRPRHQPRRHPQRPQARRAGEVADRDRDRRIVSTVRMPSAIWPTTRTARAAPACATRPRPRVPRRPSSRRSS